MLTVEVIMITAAHSPTSQAPSNTTVSINIKKGHQHTTGTFNFHKPLSIQLHSTEAPKGQILFLCPCHSQTTLECMLLKLQNDNTRCEHYLAMFL